MLAKVFRNNCLAACSTARRSATKKDEIGSVFAQNDTE